MPFELCNCYSKILLILKVISSCDGINEILKMMLSQ
jgi:hypothetical protein